MFSFLGGIISRHPRPVIILWTILALIGAGAATWGFGQGNLFQRMANSESLVPNSESDRVIVETSQETGEQFIIAVSGATSSDLSAHIESFRTDLDKIGGISEVTDPQAVTEKFQAELNEERESAIAQAVIDAEPQIQKSIDQALADAAPELEYLPEDVRTRQNADIEENVRTQVEDTVRTEAATAIDEEFSSIANPADALTSDDGFLMIATIDDPANKAAHDAAVAATDNFSISVSESIPGAIVHKMSSALLEDATMEVVASDLIRGEAIGLPVALLLLVIVFGGILAAGMPLGSAIIAILISMGVVWLLTFATNVDSFILNVLSIIGLALSIDYGLLVVSRYREEIALRLEKQGLPANGTKLPQDTTELVTESVSATVSTAGRTVSFSALTIAFCMAALLVIDAPMIRMIAFGGVVVTFLAVASAVTLVPAIIEVLGRRLIVPSALHRLPFFRTVIDKVGDSSSENGIFSKIAKWVHARPWPVLIVTVTVLVLAALPIRGLTMRSNFIEYVPETSEAKQVYDLLQTDYPEFETPHATIVAKAPIEDTTDLVTHIEALDNVSRVAEPQELDPTTTQIDFFVNSEDPVGSEVTDAVLEVREYEPGYNIFVGGAAAVQYDFNHAIIDRAPLALAIIVLSVFVLLFLMTGSIIAPLKALIINSLSLMAGMGLTVLVFTQGWFGLPQTDGLETFIVAIAIAFGFGLAMDYEVFLLARIKEYWDAGYNNDRAVELGLQRSGRIITSAAAIIVAVFIGFVFGDMLAIKQIGVALAIIVVLDATLVRMFLVPAAMTLMGRWNWWSPKPLVKVYDRFKIVH